MTALIRACPRVYQWEMSAARGRDVARSRRTKMNHTIAPTTGAIQIVVVHNVRLVPCVIIEAIDLFADMFSVSMAIVIVLISSASIASMSN